MAEDRDDRGKEKPVYRMRMTFLLWLAIFAITILFARVCSLLISAMRVR